MDGGLDGLPSVIHDVVSTWIWMRDRAAQSSAVCHPLLAPQLISHPDSPSDGSDLHAALRLSLGSSLFSAAVLAVNRDAFSLDDIRCWPAPCDRPVRFAARMNRDTVLSSNNADFLLSALRGIPNGASTIQMRLDGRTPNDRRTLALRVGTKQTAANTATQPAAANSGRAVGRAGDNSGLVEVTLGQTRVIASVTGDIVPPNPNRPAEGFLRFTVSLSPLASPSYSSASSSSTSSSDSAVELLRLLERCMKESRCVDTEALCIVSGEQVWSIRCDVSVIDDAGNAADACVVAALASLLSYRRPDVTVLSSATGGGSSVVMHSIDERQPTPLHLHHTPICTTFALFDDGALHVCDPSLDEQAVSTATVSIVVNEWHQLCGVYKLGGETMSVERLMALIAIADAKAQDALDIVKAAVGRDKTHGRGTGGVDRTAKSVAPASKSAKEAVSTAASGGGGGVAAGGESIVSDGEVKEKRMDSIDVGVKATDKKIAAGVRKIGVNGTGSMMVVDDDGAGDGGMEDDNKSTESEQKGRHR